VASRHLSLRISEESLRDLEAEARHNRENTSEIARRLIEEGLRMARHPGIVFRPGPTGRRAGLTDGPDLWEVLDAFPEWDEGWDIRSTKTLGVTSLLPSQVLTALRYYKDYPDEINERIRENREAAERSYAGWLKTQEIVRK
jgi:hypothetical protein